SFFLPSQTRRPHLLAVPYKQTLVSVTPSHASTFFLVFHVMGPLDSELNGQAKPVSILYIGRHRFLFSGHIMLSLSTNDATLTLPSLQTSLPKLSLHFDPSTVYKTSALSLNPPSSHLREIVFMLMVASVPS
ncbi:hypothetical protein V8G54_012136, partial [Vigna mungo]